MYKQWDDYFEYLKKLIWAKKKKSSTRKKKEALEEPTPQVDEEAVEYNSTEGEEDNIPETLSLDELNK